VLILLVVFIDGWVFREGGNKTLIENIKNKSKIYLECYSSYLTPNYCILLVYMLIENGHLRKDR
jgi:hypothetical protein